MVQQENCYHAPRQSPAKIPKPEDVSLLTKRPSGVAQAQWHLHPASSATSEFCDAVGRCRVDVFRRRILQRIHISEDPEMTGT